MRSAPDPASLRIDDWLSVRGAARAAGVDDSTIRRWCDQGRLPARRTAGGHRRIWARHLDELLAGRSPVPDRSPLEAVRAWVDEAQRWDRSVLESLTEDDVADLRAELVGRYGAIDQLRDLVERCDDVLNATVDLTAPPAAPAAGPSGAPSVGGTSTAPGDRPASSAPARSPELEHLLGMDIPDRYRTRRASTGVDEPDDAPTARPRPAPDPGWED